MSVSGFSGRARQAAPEAASRPYAMNNIIGPFTVAQSHAATAAALEQLNTDEYLDRLTTDERSALWLQCPRDFSNLPQAVAGLSRVLNGGIGLEEEKLTHDLKTMFGVLTPDQLAAFKFTALGDPEDLASPYHTQPRLIATTHIPAYIAAGQGATTRQELLQAVNTAPLNHPTLPTGVSRLFVLG